MRDPRAARSRRISGDRRDSRRCVATRLQLSASSTARMPYGGEGWSFMVAARDPQNLLDLQVPVHVIENLGFNRRTLLCLRRSLAPDSTDSSVTSRGSGDSSRRRPVHLPARWQLASSASSLRVRTCLWLGGDHALDPRGQCPQGQTAALSGELETFAEHGTLLAVYNIQYTTVCCKHLIIRTEPCQSIDTIRLRVALSSKRPLPSLSRHSLEMSAEGVESST